ncbi:MAG: LCP family protein [Actinomycetaceae bacterium]|nr:LCP family protein [Actinomycetaceae bacterium]
MSANDSAASVEDIFGTNETIVETVEESGQKKRRWPKVLITSFLVLLLVFGAAAAGLWFYAKNQLESMQQLGLSVEDILQEGISPDILAEGEKNADPQDLQDAQNLTPVSYINFLILGSDSRTSAGDPTKWEAEAQRTDTIMILQISPETKHMAVMSIPRDSAVVIPGYESEGRTKLNLSYAHGGLPLTMQTLQSISGIRIDHIMTVDFTTFTKLTDVVGGVTLTSQAEGTKTYNGKEALKFVRYRKGLPLSDRDRVRRQQLWMRTVVNKMFSREVLSSPSKVQEVYTSISPYVAVDNSFSLTTVLSLANAMKDADLRNTQFVTAPTYTQTEMNKDGLEIINIDYGRFLPLCYAFQSGRAWEYISSHNLDTLDSRPVQ